MSKTFSSGSLMLSFLTTVPSCCGTYGPDARSGASWDPARWRSGWKTPPQRARGRPEGNTGNGCCNDNKRRALAIIIHQIC